MKENTTFRLPRKRSSADTWTAEDEEEEKSRHRKSPRSSPRMVSKKTPNRNIVPPVRRTKDVKSPISPAAHILGASYHKYSMLSRSLPATALGGLSKDSSGRRPSDRIRSRYLDRLQIKPKRPASLGEMMSSDTVPIPIGKSRRSQEYTWDNVDDPEDADDGELSDDGNMPVTDDFFQLDDLDAVSGNEEDEEGIGEDAKDLPKRSAPMDVLRGGNATTDDRADRIQGQSRHLAFEIKGKGRRTSSAGGGTRHYEKMSRGGRGSSVLTASSFVPPHELSRRGWGQRESLGVPHHYRRRKPPEEGGIGR